MILFFIMTIWPFFLKKENDQFREGSWILVAASGSRYFLSFCLKDFFPEEYILMTLIYFVKYRIPSRATD